MAKKNDAALPIRLCVGCKQSDDHPRHDEIIQIAPELIEASWHLDCCALIKKCESCAARIVGAEGKTGNEMRSHIVSASQKET